MASQSASVAIPLRRFLTMAESPAGWPRYDLYVIRDDALVFYVGRSYNAFERVWEHLRGSFKGRSAVGRFVLVNWPQALRFTVELFSSASGRFEGVGNDPEAAEAALIAELAPCLNEALNRDPTPLPAGYHPPDAKVKHPRSLRRMMVDAEKAVHWESRRREWE
jgi:hypothetical protein